MDRSEGLAVGIFLVVHCRIDASKPKDWIAGMSIREDDAVSKRDPGQIVAALDELIGPLAYGRSVFRNCLIEAHGDSTAAIAVQNHLIYFLDAL